MVLFLLNFWFFEMSVFVVYVVIRRSCYLLKDVIDNCLKRNPDFRPTIPELLDHPFLNYGWIFFVKKKFAHDENWTHDLSFTKRMLYH